MLVGPLRALFIVVVMPHSGCNVDQDSGHLMLGPEGSLSGRWPAGLRGICAHSVQSDTVKAGRHLKAPVNPFFQLMLVSLLLHPHRGIIQPLFKSLQGQGIHFLFKRPNLS